MRPYILKETNWKAIRETQFELAVLPWGATEAHNYHLPYGTDIIEAESVAAEGARLAWEKGCKVIVLPAIPFGVNTGQFDVTLDINMNPSTQLAILHDVIDTLNRQGIHKLVIFNSHGANHFNNAIRELGLKFPNMFLSTCNWFRAVDQKGFFENKDDHAGEMETSVIMHLTPDLVLPLSEAGDGSAKTFAYTAMKEGWGWAERRWTAVTKDTGVGNPYKASAEKGEKFFKATAAKIAEFFIELCQTPDEKRYV
ncbi:MAG: creatininase family protein [Cyclobacteriaceae bacterium]